MRKQEHDVQKKEQPTIDPRHDTVMSNPEYREIFNAALEDGLTMDEAHERARHELGVSEGNEQRSKSGRLSKVAGTDFDYEAVDDALLDAHEKCVQWNADKAFGEYDISKAPGIWESRDQVPDWVIEALEELIRQGNVIWHGGYERLPPSAEAEIQRILEDRMTQPQGWSLDSLLNDLKEHYPDHDDNYLLNILRNETSAVLNTAREEAYELRDDSEEYVYDWIGPNDHRTTDTCLSIEERIEDEGGAVPMDRLKEILYEEAVAHQSGEGTPSRVSEWQPHYQCRRTFVRRVQSI